MDRADGRRFDERQLIVREAQSVLGDPPSSSHTMPSMLPVVSETHTTRCQPRLDHAPLHDTEPTRPLGRHENVRGGALLRMRTPSHVVAEDLMIMRAETDAPASPTREASAKVYADRRVLDGRVALGVLDARLCDSGGRR